MDKIEKQREHFESISERYYESRQSINHLLLKDLIWNYFFEGKDFLKKNGMNVLEPMCGYAEGKKILEKHLKTVLSYEGFDYSENLVATVKKQDPRINIITMDVTKFVPMKQYDLVILIGGLHHVPDFSRQVTRNIFESLNAGGFFINLEPTQNNPILRAIRKKIYMKNSLFDEKTERAFDLSELNTIYNNSGFKIVDQIYPGLISYILYYNPDAFPFLNIGNQSIVRFLYNFDKLFFRSFIGRTFSFATLTLMQKD